VAFVEDGIIEGNTNGKSRVRLIVVTHRVQPEIAFPLRQMAGPMCCSVEGEGGLVMTIAIDEALALMARWHETVVRGGDGDELASLFLRPEEGRVYVPHGEDISPDTNHAIHQKLADERIVQIDPWEVTQLCEAPERARLVGAVYWEARLIANPTGPLIKVMVGEDWIVQRVPGSGLKIVLYVNSYHRVLPGSAPLPSFS
jgi:hypothetical protein